MNTMEYIEERNRMCKSYGDCKGCPAFDDSEYKVNCEVSAASTLDAKLQVAIVEKWSIEHPKKQRKTRQDVFLKQYPEAQKGSNGVLSVCPSAISSSYRVGGGKCLYFSRGCTDCLREFWMAEVKENK